jgi:hypothetical protein
VFESEIASVQRPEFVVSAAHLRGQARHLTGGGGGRAHGWRTCNRLCTLDRLVWAIVRVHRAANNRGAVHARVLTIAHGTDTAPPTVGSGREVPLYQYQTDGRAMLIQLPSQQRLAVLCSLLHPWRRGLSLALCPRSSTVSSKYRQHRSSTINGHTAAAAGARVAEWQWMDGRLGLACADLVWIWLCFLSQASAAAAGQRPAIAISPLFGRTLGVSVSVCRS